MLYRLLADLVVLVHSGFVLFVVLGGLVALRWPRVARAHLPAALWGVGIEFAGGICPLTSLENNLRRLGGEAGHTGGFVEHYVLPVLYPEGLTRDGVQLVVGTFVLILNIVVYTIAWRRRSKSA